MLFKIWLYIQLHVKAICIFLNLPLALVFLLYWLVGSLVWLTCGEGQLSYPTWPWNLQGYWSQLLQWAWSRLRRERWLAEGTVWRLETEVLMMSGKDHPRWKRQYLLLSHIMCWICEDCIECCGMWWLLLNTWILPAPLLHFLFLLNSESSDVSEIRDTVSKNGVRIPFISDNVTGTVLDSICTTCCTSPKLISLIFIYLVNCSMHDSLMKGHLRWAAR